MDWYWYLIVSLLFLWSVTFLGVINRKRNKYKVLSQLQKKKNDRITFEKEIAKMEEIAKRFLGKIIIAKTIDDGNALGTLEEVTDGGMILNNDGTIKLVNLEYVISIQEIKGKKK